LAQIYHTKGQQYTAPIVSSAPPDSITPRPIGCRKCLNLSYHSQNISNEDRQLVRRERLLERYGITFEDANNSKHPKEMHQKTFEKFISEYNFINDMGINIHLDRFDYKMVLWLSKEGKKSERYDYTHNNTLKEKFG